MPGGGGMIAAGVGGVDAVEAEQGVEVDGAAGLVFGGLAVRHATGDGRSSPGQGMPRRAGELAEVAFDGLLGAPPQFPGGWLFHTTWAA